MSDSIDHNPDNVDPRKAMKVRKGHCTQSTLKGDVSQKHVMQSL